MNRSVVRTDTSDDADHLLFARWGAMTISERAELTNQLCIDVERMARAGIARERPGATEPEIVRELVRRRYGDALAAAVYPTSAPAG